MNSTPGSTTSADVVVKPTVLGSQTDVSVVTVPAKTVSQHTSIVEPSIEADDVEAPAPTNTNDSTAAENSFIDRS